MSVKSDIADAGTVVGLSKMVSAHAPAWRKALGVLRDCCAENDAQRAYVDAELQALSAIEAMCSIPGGEDVRFD